MYPQRSGVRRSVIPVVLAWLCASAAGHTAEYIRQESPQPAFESGWWNNFAVRTAFYNSTEIDADGPDTGLLAPGGENINVLGEATLRFRITDSILEGSTINLYRQTLNLPFMK